MTRIKKSSCKAAVPDAIAASDITKPADLAIILKGIVWTELALLAAFSVPVFAQSQPVASAPISTAIDSAPASAGQAAAPAGPAYVNAATAAPGSESAPINRVEVTGSMIRSADKTEFNQVQVVKATEIQDSGARTVADYLRQMSVNSGSSYSESTVLNQSPGATGVALRGLSVKYTLMLVDGQRVAPYAFPSGGTDTFSDLNTLPLNMIDRIEIVKTGAVSQYGSDAIAGVVNVITKKRYQGLQVDGNLGGAQQGGQGTSNFGVLGGFGDLNVDRFNVTSAFSYLRESGVSMAQRDITKNENYLGLSGGFFAQPSSFWTTPDGPQALSTCGPGAQVSSAENSLQTKAPGTVCSQNGASAQSLAAQVERTSLKVHADFRISDKVQAFADIWGSHNSTRLSSGLAGFGPNALVSSLYYTPGVGFAPFAPTVGGNSLSYYFPTAQAVNTTSNFYRISSGLKGSFSSANLGDWDWAASYGHSESDVTNAYTNQINASVVQNYLNSVTMNTFNPAALNTLPGLFGTSSPTARSKLDTLDATVSTANLYKMPAGDVGFGFGAQFQHQSEYVGSGSTDFVNPITLAVNGRRNIAAAYYQLDIPLLSSLSFSQSGRYDHYNDFGGVFSPRFALRFQPLRSLTMYASYDRGFRAPTLLELDAKGSVTYQVVNNQNVNEYFIGNPNLQPERTKNYNLGFQWSPSRNTDFGLDWYRIDVNNVITQVNIQSLVDANPGQPVYSLPYANIASLNTEGFEATFRQALPTRIGTFILAGDWAYVWHFRMSGITPPDFAGNNGANNTVFGGALPRWKGNTSLSWANRQWTTTLTWQYTGPYQQVINIPGASAASYSQFNLSASYARSKHWKLYASINNIFNRAPPYDPVWTSTYRGYYDPSLYTHIGRYAQIGATYTF